MTTKRSRHLVENDEYGAFVRRIVRAYARRVADGDVEALTLMLGLADEIDAAIAEAVKRLRAYGYSWAEIGAPRHHPPGRPAALGHILIRQGRMGRSRVPDRSVLPLKHERELDSSCRAKRASSPTPRLLSTLDQDL